MKRMIAVAVMGVLVVAVLLLRAAPNELSFREPISVTACELGPTYNGRQVRVTALVYNEFEDETLHHPDCSDDFPGIWYEFERRIDRKDPVFRGFDNVLKSRPGGPMLPAVLLGRYYSGSAGHLGCCSLLVIERVESYEESQNPELDFARPWDLPDLRKPGCWSQILEAPPRSEAERLQQEANKGHAGLSYDPWLVAANELVRQNPEAPGLDLNALELREVLRQNGRIVYEWTSSDRPSLIYRIGVSRPYWLLKPAGQSERVIWVPVEAYVSGCSKEPANLHPSITNSGAPI